MSLDTDCPICLENLFHSLKTSLALNCGHYVHYHCIVEYLNKARINKCPLCFKNIVEETEDYLKEMDSITEEARAQLPEQLKDKKVDILCNNCLKISNEVPYNLYGMKCKHCGSYNTRL